MRIKEHPILGTFEKGRRIQFTFDGNSMEGFEDEPIAMALRSNGVMVHRRTTKKKRAPGNILCHREVYGLYHDC